MRALSRRSRRPVEEMERYVRRVILNLVVDESRRRRRWRARLPSLAARPEVDDESGAICERLAFADALRRLPVRQRACIVLQHHEDMTVAEIAARLGCSAATVKSHLHDARRNLAAMLAPDLPERPKSRMEVDT